MQVAQCNSVSSSRREKCSGNSLKNGLSKWWKFYEWWCCAYVRNLKKAELMFTMKEDNDTSLLQKMELFNDLTKWYEKTRHLPYVSCLSISSSFKITVYTILTKHLRYKKCALHRFQSSCLMTTKVAERLYCWCPSSFMRLKVKILWNQ